MGRRVFFCAMRTVFAFIAVSLAGAALAAGSAKIKNSHADPKYGKPVEFSKVAGTKGTMALEISGGKLYALEDNGLSVYDISEPNSPRLLGSVGGMGNVRQLKVSGKTAFVTSRQCGLWSVDVSDPSSPKILSHFDTAEMATGLDVADGLAFVGNRVFGVQCVDVSDPSKMRHVSSVVTQESQSVYYRDGIAYSGDWGAGEITAIDFSDPANPKIISKTRLDGYGDGVEVDGNFLYASTGQHKKSGPPELRHGAGHGLEIFDISDGRNPRRISRAEFPSIYFGPCDFWTPRVSGDYCFASDTVNGVFVLDISDKSAPKITGNFILPKVAPDDPSLKIPYKQILDPNIPQGDAVASIAVGDGVLYVAGNFTGIYMAEFPGIAKIREGERLAKAAARPGAYSPKIPGNFDSVGADPSNPVRAVAVNGDFAYAAASHRGVEIYDLSGGKIASAGRINCPYASDVKVSDGRLAVALGFGGVGIYDISGRFAANPAEIGRIPANRAGAPFAQNVWAFDGCKFMGVSGAGISVVFFDISNPASPKRVFSQAGSQLLYNDYGSRKLAAGRYFALNRHCGGRMIFDMSGDKPKTVFYDDRPLCSQTGSVAAFGGKILTMFRGGYAVDDPSAPAENGKLKREKFPGGGALPAVSGGASEIERAEFPQGSDEGLAMFDENSKRLAVANRITGKTSLYDFSDAKAPKLIGRWALPSNPGIPDFYKGRLVVPCGHAGLLIERR